MKNLQTILSLLLLFVWCFQLSIPNLCLAHSTLKCNMPCCALPVPAQALLDGESGASAPSCCQAAESVPSEHAQADSHGNKDCSAKLCSQSNIFVTPPDAEAFARAESGIKYLLPDEERVSPQYFAELFRPPRS